MAITAGLIVAFDRCLFCLKMSSPVTSVIMNIYNNFALYITIRSRVRSPYETDGRTDGLQRLIRAHTGRQHNKEAIHSRQAL